MAGVEPAIFGFVDQCVFQFHYIPKLKVQPRTSVLETEVLLSHHLYIHSEQTNKILRFQDSGLDAIATSLIEASYQNLLGWL